MSQLYLTSKQIDGAVRKLYAGNGYSVLSQVRNGTGLSNEVRTADMLAISTWPSRGLFAEGIEIKSDKGDLKRELANPAKADEIAQYCERWWIACPEGLTEGLMIPPNWGVITVNAKLLSKVAVKGSALTAKPMDILLVCSILRNFTDGYIPREEVAPLVEKARNEERERVSSNLKYRHEQLEKAVASFQESSGIEILGPNGHASWELGRIGEAVKLIVAMRHKPLQEIMEARTALTSVVAAIDTALNALGQNQ